jgi:serine/threonine protein kinase SCH9
MLRDIIEKPIPMKPYFSENAASFLKALLQRDPAKRIGSSEKDAAELKAHPFFEGIDWDKVATMTYETAFKPKVKGDEDVSCIDKLFTREGLEETYVDPSALNGQ